jgi:hypothetical protein
MMLLLCRVVTALLPVALLYWSACTPMTSNESSSTGGTGSEVVGVVEYPDNSSAAKNLAQERTQLIPLVDGKVFINPKEYLAAPGNGREIPKTYTASDGTFRITKVLPGEHLLYVRDENGNSVACRFTAPVDPQPINLGSLYARKTAGVFIQYTGSIPGDVQFYVDVLGTGMQLSCSGGNLSATLEGIPTGVEQYVVVRMFKPVEKRYDLAPVNLVPGMVSTLESITGN